MSESRSPFSPAPDQIPGGVKEISVSSELPAPPPGLNMGRNLAQMVAALAALLVLVNLPFNTRGVGLAQLSPQATSVVIYDGMLLQGSGPDIYLLAEHKLRRFSSPEAMISPYVHSKSVNRVEDSLLAQFGQGQPIRRWLTCSANPQIYALENGQKRLCANGCTPAVQPASPWDKINRVSCKYLDHLPTGPALSADIRPASGASQMLDWGQLLLNPSGHLTAATLRAWLATYLPLMGWLAGVVGLIGGTWLVWQQFRSEKSETAQNQDSLAAYLAQALLYQTQIQRALRATTPARDQAHRQQLAAQIKVWITAIQALIRRISAWQQDHLIRREMVAIPIAIETLQTQLAHESDPTLRRHLQRALANRHNQLASLQGLQRTIQQAELQIENTLSLLGLIYSQILAGQSTRQVANYSRLSAEVDEEVQRLQDWLAALQEVKEGAIKS